MDLSIFPDDLFYRVKSRDMIEHISWRMIPTALREWLRVTRGWVEIETPNALEFEAILSGRGTDSHMSGETNWQHFNRVAFGHQDYPENTHRSYFTPKWLTELLYEAGASHVWTIYENPTRFQLGGRK